MHRKIFTSSCFAVVFTLLGAGNSYALDPQPEPPMKKPVMGQSVRQHQQHKSPVTVKGASSSVKQEALQKGKCGGWCGSPQKDSMPNP